MLGAVGKGVNAMTPDPVPSIPSREAVDLDVELRKAENIFRSAGRGEYADGIKYARKATKPYRDAILAEVERLTADKQNMVVAMNELSKQSVGIVDENAQLRATVAAQAAELEKVRKDAERFNWLAENVWMWTPPKVDAPYAKVEIWLDSERKFQVGWHDSVGVASLRTAIDAALAQSASQMDALGAKG
jgi:hypothetical protein